MAARVQLQEEELQKKKALATPDYAELATMVRGATLGGSSGQQNAVSQTADHSAT